MLSAFAWGAVRRSPERSRLGGIPAPVQNFEGRDSSPAAQN